MSLAELPSHIGRLVARAGAYVGAMCLALGGFGLVLGACSSDGVTPTCDEAQLFSNRYDDEDLADYKENIAAKTPEANRNLADNADQDQAKLAALAKQKCVTGPGALGTGSSNGGSGSSGGAAGAAGAAGSN